MMMTDWEAESKRLGYPGEKEMWEDLYPKNSLSQLVTKFGKSINNIRTRIDFFSIPIKGRGGANHVKLEVDKQLMDDVITMGVRAAAVKHKLRPQQLYQKLYYKCGVTVKGLREAAAKEVSTPSPEVDPVVDE